MSQQTVSFTEHKNRGNLGLRNIGKIWFKYTLIDITPLGFRFRFVTHILFSKSTRLKIYLSAILSLINDISKYQKGFPTYIFRCRLVFYSNLLVSSNSLICFSKSYGCICCKLWVTKFLILILVSVFNLISFLHFKKINNNVSTIRL